MKSLALNFEGSPDLEQEFKISGKCVRRTIQTSKGARSASVKMTRRCGRADANYFASALDGNIEYDAPDKGSVRYVDLFSGGGGLSLGVTEALRFLGYKPRCAFAADTDKNAIKLIDAHFSPSILHTGDVDEIVRYQIDYSGVSKKYIHEPEITDPELAAYAGKIDLVVGGPPCQGHSNLNNKTRRKDPRNLLYFSVPSIAIALGANCILIENVRSIMRSEEQVVQITRQLLREYGYHVDEIILNASEFGVAQLRERHFLLAKRDGSFDLHAAADAFRAPPLSFKDVNGSLRQVDFPAQEIEAIPELSGENINRIDYLHDNNVDDLPAFIRPVCHQNGHTYPSVYGRMKLDQPAQTITTGFASPGRGRFVHPTERRVMTNREAARLQSFPDWFWECDATAELDRAHFQKIIGDAVPPNIVMPLMYALYGI